MRFTREVETAIYRNLLHGLGRLNKRPPNVPVGFVGGTESIECRQAGQKATKELMGDNYVLIPGGHLIPMEVPAHTATAVLSMLERMKLNLI